MLYIFAFLSIMCTNNLYASEYESKIASKISDFAEKLIDKYKLNEGASIAIADFDNIGDSSKKYNIGFTVSEVITQSFQQKNRYIVIEKKQINNIIETLSLQQTGLYDYDKIVSLGKLIGARYIVVGSVNDFAGFYRITVRIVKIETGEIISADALELDKHLIEEESEKYLPANYRFSISGIYKYKHKFEEYQSEGGFDIGFSYDIKKNHSILFDFRYNFYKKNRIGFEDFWATGFAWTYYNFDHSIEFMLGYGYIIPLTRNLSFRPKINLGYSHLIYQIWYNKEEYEGVRYYYETGLKSCNLFFIQPGFDLLLMYNNPVSIFLSLSYDKYLSKFKFSQKYHNYPEYTSEKDLSALEIRMGVQVFI